MFPSIDTRSLALFRLGLSVTLFCTLLRHIHFDTVLHTCMIMAGFVYCAALFFGYRTRPAAAMIFLLVVVFDAAGFMHPGTGHAIVRMLLCWSILIPLATAFSVDAALDCVNRSTARSVSTAATAAIKIAILLQWLKTLYSSSSAPENGVLYITALLCAVSVFIPKMVWDRSFQFLHNVSRMHITIYYDGACGFCRKSVALLKTFLLLPTTHIREAQRYPVILREMERENSWVVDDETGKRYFKFDALRAVCAVSPLFSWAVPLLGWAPLARWGTRAYEITASHRDYGARILGALKEQPNVFRFTLLNNLAAGLLLCYVFLNCLSALFHVRMSWLPQEAIRAVLGF